MSSVNNMINYCYQNARHSIWKLDSCSFARSCLKQHIRTNVVLTKAEKEEIKDFYGRYGFRVNTVYHQWYYTVTGKHDVRFLPDWMLSCALTEKLNDVRMMHAWTDKSYLERFVPEAKYPTVLIRNVNGILFDSAFCPLTKKDAQAILSDRERVIVKPSVDSGGGSNVQAFDGDIQLSAISNSFKSNFVVQEFLRQHPSTAALNETSVNTIRIISLLWEGEVYICGVTLRTGIKGAITDNISHGHGIAIGLQMDGTLDPICYANNGEAFETSTQYNLENGHRIASVDKAVEFVQYHHQRLPYFKLIAWDLAVDENGHIVILEYNVKAIGITLFQYNTGPLFGELTEAVLKEYRRNRSR